MGMHREEFVYPAVPASQSAFNLATYEDEELVGERSDEISIVCWSFWISH